MTNLLLTALGVILLMQLLTIMKLSELNGRLTTVENKINTLLANQSPPADPDLPADLEATVTRLEGKLSGVVETPNPS